MSPPDYQRGDGSPPPKPDAELSNSDDLEGKGLDSQAADIELQYVDEKSGFTSQSALVELTPLEALKANVDGDQSPCGSLMIVVR